MIEITSILIALAIIIIAVAYLMIRKACWKCIYGGIVPSDPSSKDVLCINDGCVKKPNHCCGKFVGR